jgi:cobalt-zinc-cadmium efflux system protein
MHQIKNTTDHHHESEKNISYAFFLNLGFTIVEIIGGFMTNSVAILSDAIHDFGDSVSLGLAWFLQRFSKKESDQYYSYGYKRFSLLGAIINSVILLVGSILILLETIPRIFHPETPDARGMFILAILGIIVNGAAVIKLRKGNSINEKVVSLHLWEDVLGWVAILVGSVLMYFFNIPVIDPILSILISIYILIHVFRNIKISMRIILQGTPVEIDTEEVKSTLLEFEEISDIHDLHIWSVDGNYNVVTTHVVLKKELPLNQLATLKLEIRKKLEELNIEHATLEFETGDEDCSFESCSH